MPPHLNDDISIERYIFIPPPPTFLYDIFTELFLYKNAKRIEQRFSFPEKGRYILNYIQLLSDDDLPLTVNVRFVVFIRNLGSSVRCLGF